MMMENKLSINLSDDNQDSVIRNQIKAVTLLSGFTMFNGLFKTPKTKMAGLLYVGRSVEATKKSPNFSVSTGRRNNKDLME